MNISNVVLDRDKKSVTFDDDHSVDIQRDLLWAGEHTGWIVNEEREASWDKELNDLLQGVEHTGLSLINISAGRLTATRTVLNPHKPDQEPTPDYYNKTFKGVKVDYYRVAELFDLGSGPRAHSVKYLLRGTNKDDGINTELELIKAVRKKLVRWEEMIKEDAE